jgi:hypothetical protein
MLACLMFMGGLLVMGANPASADPPLPHWRGEATLDDQGGTFPGPFTTVLTGRNNCSHVGVQDVVVVAQVTIDLPVQLCDGGLGITGTRTNISTATRPDGKSQIVHQNGPITDCLPLTPPTGAVTTSTVEVLTVLSATGKYAKHGAVSGCVITQSVTQTIDHDADPPTQVYDVEVLSSTC